MELMNLAYKFASVTQSTILKREEGYATACPVLDSHKDDRASRTLLVAQNADGSAQVFCSKGCSEESICTAAGLPLCKQLVLTPIKRAVIPDVSKIPRTVEYHYTDEQGNILCTKVRSEPNVVGGRKTFYWQHTTAGGSVVKTREGCRHTLYKLPEVIRAVAEGQQIFLVEGEKDVATLMSYGLVATTTGTSTEWEEDYARILSGADLVLLRDYDNAGVKRRDMIIRKLSPYVLAKNLRLRVVDLPGLIDEPSHGKDITDWLGMGNNVEQLNALVEQTTDYTPESSDAKASSPGLQVLTYDEIVAWEPKPREMLLTPFLPSQGLAMLVAKRGVGKTHIALGIAIAVATGRSFLKWTAPAAKRVLYIDGEMPGSLIRERSIMATEIIGANPGLNLTMLTPDKLDMVMPDLSRPEGRKLIDTCLRDVDLVVLDNISCLFRSGGENESESWQDIQEWALDLRRRGKSILFVHHASKGGLQRGTSKREDILDTVIMLKHADEYRSEEGASFNVTFDKARHFMGEDARGFHARLFKGDEKYYWDISDISDDNSFKEVVEKKKLGNTIMKIVEDTGLTKSQVETRIKKGRDQGLL